jgi:hypothetical protein
MCSVARLRARLHGAGGIDLLDEDPLGDRVWVAVGPPASPVLVAEALGVVLPLAAVD